MLEDRNNLENENKALYPKVNISQIDQNKCWQIINVWLNQIASFFVLSLFLFFLPVFHKNFIGTLSHSFTFDVWGLLLYQGRVGYLQGDHMACKVEKFTIWPFADKSLLTPGLKDCVINSETAFL